jgi:hypothetical protein
MQHGIYEFHSPAPFILSHWWSSALDDLDRARWMGRWETQNGTEREVKRRNSEMKTSIYQNNASKSGEDQLSFSTDSANTTYRIAWLN